MRAAGDPAEMVAEPRADQGAIEAYRRELTGYCYRMLGSAFDAEDAVQEIMTKAWRARERFQGRSSLRTWLYRIATNHCLDQLASKHRRVRPMDLGPASTVASAQLVTRPEGSWVEPIPDGWVLSNDADPAERALMKETIRLAFVTALQHLPPQQRAVLLLREVLRWRAAEVAELLETSVPAVNSALQRARATLAQRDVRRSEPLDELDPAQQALLADFVDAFERYDMKALAQLLHDDATQSMPPFDLWLQGRDEVVGWMVGPGAECEGSRLLPTSANGTPAYGQYRRAADGSGYEPWALQIVEIVDGQIVGMNAYLDVGRWFPMFGLPTRLPAHTAATP